LQALRAESCFFLCPTMVACCSIKFARNNYLQRSSLTQLMPQVFFNSIIMGDKLRKSEPSFRLAFWSWVRSCPSTEYSKACQLTKAWFAPSVKEPDFSLLPLISRDWKPPFKKIHLSPVCTVTSKQKKFTEAFSTLNQKWYPSTNASLACSWPATTWTTWCS